MASLALATICSTNVSRRIRRPDHRHRRLVENGVAQKRENRALSAPPNLTTLILLVGTRAERLKLITSDPRSGDTLLLVGRSERPDLFQEPLELQPREPLRKCHPEPPPSRAHG